jgi:hypothetical protein
MAQKTTLGILIAVVSGRFMQSPLEIKRLKDIASTAILADSTFFSKYREIKLIHRAKRIAPLKEQLSPDYYKPSINNHVVRPVNVAAFLIGSTDTGSYW